MSMLRISHLPRRGAPQTPAIPKIFHQVWLGGKPFPADAQAFQDTWRVLHPDWEWRLWTDADLPSLQNQDALAQSFHLAMKSDIVRYEALCRCGGVYMDTDVECLRAIDPLLDGVTAFAGWESGDSLCNAILGGTPGHPLLRRLVDELPESFRRNKTNLTIAGPLYLTALATTTPGVTLFAPPVLYPYHWTEMERRHETFPHAFTAHHWSGSWVEKAAA